MTTGRINQVARPHRRADKETGTRQPASGMKRQAPSRLSYIERAFVRDATAAGHEPVSFATSETNSVSEVALEAQARRALAPRGNAAQTIRPQRNSHGGPQRGNRVLSTTSRSLGTSMQALVDGAEWLEPQE